MSSSAVIALLQSALALLTFIQQDPSISPAASSAAIATVSQVVATTTANIQSNKPGVFALLAPGDNATLDATSSALLSWEPSARATQYNVFVSTASNAGVGSDGIRGRVPATSLAVTKLSPNTTYYWQVQARNAYGVIASPVRKFKTASQPAPVVADNASAPTVSTLTAALQAADTTDDFELVTSPVAEDASEADARSSSATMAAASSGSGPKSEMATGTAPVRRVNPFNTRCASVWEICYEGTGLPGDNMRPNLFWDNPVDDAWRKEVFRQSVWQIKQDKGIRLLAVDRTVAPGPAWIFRRDEMFASASGIEISARFRIPNNSTPNSVALAYFDGAYQFSLILNPKNIIFNPAVNYHPETSKGAVTISIDLTTTQELYVAKAPNSGTVQIYRRVAAGAKNSQTIDGKYFEPLTGQSLVAMQQTYPAAKRIKPFILFGANRSAQRESNGTISKTYPGAYELDFLRYRRFGFAGGTLAPRQPQTPLPLAEATSSHFIDGYVNPAFMPAGSKPYGAKQTMATTSTMRIKDFTPTGNEGAYTIEWKMRLHADAPTPAFELSFFDQDSSYAIGVDPDGVRAMMYGKPVSSTTTVPRRVTLTEWTCFRFVKPANSQYGFLYVADRDYPVIADIKGGAAGWQYSGLMFGANLAPRHADAAWAQRGELKGLGRYAPAADVAFIRWSARALAPNPVLQNCTNNQ